MRHSLASHPDLPVEIHKRRRAIQGGYISLILGIIALLFLPFFRTPAMILWIISLCGQAWFSRILRETTGNQANMRSSHLDEYEFERSLRAKTLGMYTAMMSLCLVILVLIPLYFAATYLNFPPENALTLVFAVSLASATAIQTTSFVMHKHIAQGMNRDELLNQHAD